ncbi:MAG: uroporphyrinogen-III C-methyltransferase [Betaproteobacteria bacterium]|nr:uroporphyrinogen-III C-methyltransferase [Betaproteobacteria bacterium]
MSELSPNASPEGRRESPTVGRPPGGGDNTAPRATPSPSAGQPARSRRSRAALVWRWSGPALGLAALVFAFTLGQRVDQLEGGALRRLDGGDKRIAQLEASLKVSQDLVRDLQQRQALVDSRMAEAQSLYSQVEKLYRGLIQESADAVLAEAESVISLATQQLSLGTDPRAAVMALQEVDHRLVRQKDPTLAPLRKALLGDIERLKAHPVADIAGMAARIDGLITLVEQLPLSSTVQARPRATDPNAPGRPGGFEEGLASSGIAYLREELQKLIRVRRVDEPDSVLLAPDQAYFLRENMRLILLNARLGMLARNELQFQTDLGRAIDWLTRYYEADNRLVVGALTQLKQLRTARLGLEPPLPGESLRAVRAIRSSRESRG